MTGPERATTLDPAEDARLVQRCLAGDARAWEALVRRHERLVYAVARTYSLEEADLADVFQDVFTALVKGLPRLRDARALVRWLSSTTDRIALATALRRRRERAMTADPEGLERVAGSDPWVGADLEELEEQATVRLALAGLHERCRRLLTALYYEDPPPSYAGLARRLGVPIGSLGPTRARCMERLRRGLAALAAAGGGISPGPPPTSETEDAQHRRAPGGEDIPPPDRTEEHR